MVNEDTAVIHIGRAIQEFMASMRSSTRSRFRAFPETKYINREEDMGKKACTKQKTYYPSGFVHKYDVYIE